MSAAFIEGNISLTHGHRDPSTIAPPYYTFYSTALQCTNTHVIKGDVRVYSPPNEPLLADETAVHIVGRFFAPPSGTILIDTLSLTPFPGNPCDDTYEDLLPNNTTLRITVVGGVSTTARTSSEETSRGFDLHVTEYV